MVKAADHDFQPEEKLIPFGIFLPQDHELSLYFNNSKLTSDFIVDCLQAFWMAVRERFPRVKTLLLNLDNGPENHSRGTQFMKRITEFSDSFQVNIELAYYPPYHSKYNPIERVWGILEQHWNGSLLDTREAVLKFAQTMSYTGHSPTVSFIHKTCHTGIRLSQKEMANRDREEQSR